MKKKLAFLFIALAASAGLGLFSPTAQAASGCWQVDCNTCCKTTGPVICTQRACA